MRESLAALPGVRDVQIEFEEKHAIVKVDPDFADPQRLIKALEQENFGGSVIEDTGDDD